MAEILEKLKYISEGGIEAFIFGMYDNISSGNLEICFYSDNAIESERYFKKIKNEAIKLYPPKRNYSKISPRPFRMFLKWTDFITLVRKNKFSVIHIHLTRPYDILYALAAKLGGAEKILCHSHASQRKDISIFENAFNPFLRLLAVSCTDKYAACSQAAADYMFPKKICKSHSWHLLKNGIDANAFVFDAAKRTAVRKQLKIDDKFVIGNVGRFALQKNHTFLLDVFLCLHQKCPNALLMLIGGGELEDSIKRKAHELKLDEFILFLGAAPAEKYYHAMDCFAFPSLFEGLGIAAIEAQAAGLKTLCSDGVPQEAKITALAEHLSLKSGAEAWADKLLEYNNGYERRDMSMEIKASGYDVKSTAEELEKIYIDLIKGDL